MSNVGVIDQSVKVVVVDWALSFGELVFSKLCRMCDTIVCGCNEEDVPADVSCDVDLCCCI